MSSKVLSNLAGSVKDRGKQRLAQSRGGGVLALGAREARLLLGAQGGGSDTECESQGKAFYVSVLGETC